MTKKHINKKNIKAQKQNHDNLFKLRVTNFTFSLLAIVGLIAGKRYLTGTVSGNLSSGGIDTILSAMLIIGYVRFRVSLRILKLNLRDETDSTQTLARNLNILRLALGVLALSLLAFLFIYNSQIPSRVSYFFAIQFPQLTNNVVDVASNIFTSIFSLIAGAVGNIFLGVIGNLVYDLLKKLLSKRKK